MGNRPPEVSANHGRAQPNPILLDLQENRGSNPYLRQVWISLPRLLALFDTDPLRPSQGLGDRLFWGWKLSDFANGTFQGAAHGLARLLVHGLLPPWLEPQSVASRIAAMFAATRRLCRRDGSLEEAFPYESSFCVTALVAFDLLSAVELLEDKLDPARRAEYLATVRPLIRFLHQADEYHGFISNHLATAAAALFKWSHLAKEPGAERGRMFLERLLSHQSPEGWFPEYQGADPGYLTFTLYYLADLYRLVPEPALYRALAGAVDFLSLCIHPDGSLGGLYGSRHTRFYCPAGLEALAPRLTQAAALAQFMRGSVDRLTTVTLLSMDEPNLVPMFNAYCWAAVLVAKQKEQTTRAAPPPCLRPGTWRKKLPQAGLLFDKGPSHYTVVSWHQGGVCYHFREKRMVVADAGVAARGPRGRIFTTQVYCTANTLRLEGDTCVVTARFAAAHHRLPTPLGFCLLRLVAATLMRFSPVNRALKWLLVRLLITGRRWAPLWNRRVIHLGAELKIDDRWWGRVDRFRPLEGPLAFSAIHMASQGYWQRQDDSP